MLPETNQDPQVTGLETPETEQEEELLRQIEQLRAAREARANNNQPNNQPNTVWEVEDPLNKGSKLAFRSPQEVQSYLESVVQVAAQVTEQERKERERIAQEAANLSEKKQVEQRQTQPQPRKLSPEEKAKYFRLLEEDPIEAQNYLDELRGLQSTIHNAIQQQQQLAQVTQQLMVENILQRFQSSNPDYDGSEQAQKAVLEALKQTGIPFTPQGLSAAWQYAKANGWVNDKQQPAPQPKVKPITPPVPNVRGGGKKTNSALDESVLENLSLEELEHLQRMRHVG
jgi:hypothetical protein